MATARQSLQALLAETLADPAASFGYALDGIAFGEAVEVTLAKGGATFAMWLRPAADATPCYRQTAQFKVGHYPDPPDRQGYALIDAACARIEAWEGSLREEALGQLFDAQPEIRSDSAVAREWLAVSSGLKPAARNLVRAGGADRLLEHVRSRGLHAQRTEAGAFIAGFRGDGVREHMTTLVHVARSAEAAGAAAQAERSMIDSCNRGERPTESQVRALGAALGYPECCIEAFLPLRDRSNAEIRFAALRRTAGPASRLLNDLELERALVSHAPCRYDCPASLRYAQALLRELARVDPAAARELDDRLRGLIVMFRAGGALRLVAAAPDTAGAYRFAAVEASGTGERCDAWRTVLCDADGVDVGEDSVRILRGDDEVRRLGAPPDEVQIRLFA